MINKHTYCVIMAGGIGTRFWPLSTSKYPKQFHDVLGVGSTLIQQTYTRLLKVTAPDKIYVVTDRVYVDLVKEQLPDLDENQIITEPVGMNTAPCILYASLKIDKISPDAHMVVCPSDHLIIDTDTFAHQINLAKQSIENYDGLYTLGINPTRPDTGYGYIQFIESTNPVKQVKTFTEKPNAELAEQFLQSGDFLWNSGIFIWRTKTVLQAFQKYLPDMYSAMLEINSSICTEQEKAAIAKVYPTLQRVSIDIGILEKFDEVFVLPSSFGWSDLGTWTSLYESLPKDEKQNVTCGQIVKMYDASKNIVNVQENKAVVIEGLNNYIVVDTPEALLICPLSSDQAVKTFVNDIKLTKGGDKFI